VVVVVAVEEILHRLGVQAVAVRAVIQQQREQQILAVAVAVHIPLQMVALAVPVLLFFLYQPQTILEQLQVHQQSQHQAQTLF
jgi:hypothetical protein